MRCSFFRRVCTSCTLTLPPLQVFADIPGLVEGASLGVGLGHTFLAHCLRCRVLVHLLDGAAAGELGPDGEERKAGSLFEDFEPPFNPPAEIPDPDDKKPDDWVDEAK